MLGKIKDDVEFMLKALLVAFFVGLLLVGVIAPAAIALHYIPGVAVCHD